MAEWSRVGIVLQSKANVELMVAPCMYLRWCLGRGGQGCLCGMVQ